MLTKMHSRFEKVRTIGWDEEKRSVILPLCIVVRDLRFLSHFAFLSHLVVG